MSIQGQDSMGHLDDLDQQLTSFLQVDDVHVINELNGLYNLDSFTKTRESNQAATIVGRSNKLKGDVKIEGFTDAFEISGLKLSGYLRQLAGFNGKYQGNSKVDMQHLMLALPNGNDAVIAKILHAAETGEDIGELYIAFLRNVGPTAQVQFEWKFLDTQVSSVIVKENKILFAVGYAKFEMTYKVMDDEKKAKGVVSTGFDLTRNKVKTD